ncbi:MAG: Ni/Fe hydrogenase subunit alpha [Spirochaetota bacterium]|nr:MAG: Ni/Fe hydrogenase subunit alpha [Spirochaetota bacterium]
MSTISLDHISKIEGHASLNIKIEKNELKNLELEMVEGARFFENILKGKKYDELPLISARICGVCSPAHTLTAVRAVEDAFGINPNKTVKLLRELLAIGGLLQSHILHLYFLLLPGCLGYGSALQMIPKYQKEINRALKIKRLGNRIMTAIGGRDIHPLTVVAGGFSKYPSSEDLKSLMEELKVVQEDALKTFDLFSRLTFPNFEHKSTYIAVHGKNLLGDKISLLENAIPKQFPHDYEEYMKKYFQHDSTAEFVVIEGKGYTVGAQARLNVNWNLQDKELRDLLKVKSPSHSPFSNVVFQSFEIMSGVKRAIEIINELIENPINTDPPKEVKPKASTGIGVMEAPRGLLFHKYTFDEHGYCTYANVTTPTSQNLKMLEDCLEAFVKAHLHLPKDTLITEVEKLIRAFDPCISCSSH